MEISSNNKRIAKNTIFLYIRMIIVMVVSLFTVRVVLNALGTEDYGINNVVGGIVTMFAFLTSTMVSASMRFFAYSLGQKDEQKLSDYFTTSFWCYVILIAFIVVLAETLGLWFVKTQLTIPANRMDAALWVYQCSVISFAFSIITIPYNSIIIAREKMDMYAYVGLLEVFLKLAVAYAIMIVSFDNLKAYSVLLCIAGLITNLFYIVYGTVRFKECRVKRLWNKAVLKEVVSYSGWSLFGAVSGIFRGQGINILLNIFFNPAVNAARAIAYQVNTAINQFVLNFHKAVQPQITKYYATGDYDDFFILIFRSSRLYYYLIFLLSLPILLETPYILTLWLKILPENTILFTRLVIIIAIIDSMSYPIQTSIASTGKIKYFQLVTGGLLILNLPVSYVFLKIGYPPEIAMYIAIVFSIIAQFLRIVFSHHLCNLPISGYIKDVITPIVLVTILSLTIPIILEWSINNALYRFLCVTIVSLFVTCIVIYLFGITKREREMLTIYIQNKTKIFKCNPSN